MLEILYVIFCKLFLPFFIVPIFINNYREVVKRNENQSRIPIPFSNLINFTISCLLGMVIVMGISVVNWKTYDTFKASEVVVETFHGIMLLIESMLMIYFVGISKYKPRAITVTHTFHHLNLFIINIHTSIYFGFTCATYINEVPALMIAQNGSIILIVLFVLVMLPSSYQIKRRYYLYFYLFGLISLSKAIQIPTIQRFISMGPFLWNIDCCGKMSIEFYSILHNIFGIPVRLSLVDILLQLIYGTAILSVPTILTSINAIEENIRKSDTSIQTLKQKSNKTKRNVKFKKNNKEHSRIQKRDYVNNV